MMLAGLKVLVSALAVGWSVAVAANSDGAPPAGSLPQLLVGGIPQNAVSAAPRTSTPGAPRVIFVRGCAGAAALDESQVPSGRLLVRLNTNIVFCSTTEAALNFVPRSTGALRVQLVDEANNVLAESPMDTVAPSRAQSNVDGMWADPATNGSGIAIHHAVASDAAFGTWFLFGSLPNGGTRWLSLQSTSWINGGRTLVGLAYEVGGDSAFACPAGDDCPRPAASARPVGSVAMQILESDRAFIEAYDRFGRLAITSQLRRLQF